MLCLLLPNEFPTWTIKLYCVALYCTVLQCTVQSCTVLYSTVLYCTIVYCIVLHCTILYCIVQYCTVLYNTVQYYHLPLEMERGVRIARNEAVQETTAHTKVSHSSEAFTLIVTR